MRWSYYERGRWDRTISKEMRQGEIANEVDRRAKRDERLRERGLLPLAGPNAKGKGKPRNVRQAINRAIKRDALLPNPRICGVCGKPKPKSRQWVVNEGQQPICKACYVKENKNE